MVSASDNPDILFNY